eukprot:GHVO01037021.1.p1 GENE.GHVO01037021.1~~GHVO01037021.1.p1  ORF type:complete len:235 (+),score=14.70 GHVO01037021.1:137-841(+)
MVSEEELSQLKSVLLECIQTTCQLKLKLTSAFKLDAVIAITSDDGQVIAVNLSESIPPSDCKRVTSDDDRSAKKQKTDEADEIDTKSASRKENSSSPPSSKMDSQPLTLNRHATLVNRIIAFPGPYAPIRSVQRRNGTFSSANICLVMREMTVAPQHPRYIGEFRELVHESRPIRVFYKRPPDSISAEVLQSYGITRQAYRDAYYADLRAYQKNHTKDLLYRDMLKQGSPFRTF